jgi:hypothetical protein
MRMITRRLLGALRLTTSGEFEPPHNQRMQQPISSASRFASGLAPDPKH